MCVAAVVVWCFLLAVPLMLIVTHSPFTGNPLYTLLIGAAIALTLGGMMLRCRDQLAALTPRRRPTSRRSIIYKSTRPPTDSVHDDVLPSPGTVAAMRRLARKATNID
jgi:hypothetical protein